MEIIPEDIFNIISSRVDWRNVARLSAVNKHFNEMVRRYLSGLEKVGRVHMHPHQSVAVRKIMGALAECSGKIVYFYGCQGFGKTLVALEVASRYLASDKMEKNGFIVIAVQTLCSGKMWRQEINRYYYTPHCIMDRKIVFVDGNHKIFGQTSTIEKENKILIMDIYCLKRGMSTFGATPAFVIIAEDITETRVTTITGASEFKKDTPVLVIGNSIENLGPEFLRSSCECVHVEMVPKIMPKATFKVVYDSEPIVSLNSVMTGKHNVVMVPKMSWLKKFSGKITKTNKKNFIADGGVMMFHFADNSVNVNYCDNLVIIFCDSDMSQLREVIAKFLRPSLYYGEMQVTLVPLSPRSFIVSLMMTVRCWGFEVLDLKYELLVKKVPIEQLMKLSPAEKFLLFSKSCNLDSVYEDSYEMVTDVGVLMSIKKWIY